MKILNTHLNKKQSQVKNKLVFLWFRSFHYNVVHLKNTVFIFYIKEESFKARALKTSGMLLTLTQPNIFLSINLHLSSVEFICSSKHYCRCGCYLYASTSHTWEVWNIISSEFTFKMKLIMIYWTFSNSKKQKTSITVPPFFVQCSSSVEPIV